MRIHGQHILRRTATGLTLVESMLAMAILAAAFLGVISTASVGHQHLHAADREFRAIRLARDLMEEIASKRYTDPEVADVFGPEAGEMRRADCDDVNDYNGLIEAAGQVRDMTGALYPSDHQGVSRQVSVAPAVTTVPGLDMVVVGVNVTVTVREQPKGKLWQITRFIPEPPH